MSRYDNRSVEDLRLDVASAVGEGVPVMEYLRRRVRREWGR